MKKLILPLSIIIGCAIIGLFIYAGKVSEKNIINKINNWTKNDFGQKEKCAQYMEKSKEGIRYANEQNKVNEADGIFMSDGFVEVFYSPKLNTCLSYETSDFSNVKLNIQKRDFLLYDLLSNKKILERKSDDGYTNERFLEEIKQYR